MIKEYEGGRYEIPKTPDHCAARDYAHSMGVKIPHTCNHCKHPDPDDYNDCITMRALESVYDKMRTLREAHPPTFDKPGYRHVKSFEYGGLTMHIESDKRYMRVYLEYGMRKVYLLSMPIKRLTD